MEIKTNIIDNFLNHEELSQIKNNLLSNKFPLYYTPVVSGDDINSAPWNYYFVHEFYKGDKVKSEFYDYLYEIFIEKFKKIYPYKSLIRIKLNFYPHTENLREHNKHVDSDFSHYGAVFSINTCNGFTRLHDGTKIDSVENRIVFFDPSLEHNSTTTTTSSGRWNINFNFI